MDYKGDSYYIEQVLAGKLNAYSYIVDHHKDKAFNLAFRICGNREEGEEITQDSFLKAFRSLNNFRMKSSFATWLYRIIYNTAITHIRTRKEILRSLEEFPADSLDFAGNNNDDEEADKEYKESIVNYALSKVEDEDRGLICLYYYEEMKIDEISEATGISNSNVKIRLYRTRQKMLEIIEKLEKRNSIVYENTARYK
jgi:RNA polymerase sigma factor (sigma-70 family)